MFETDKERKKMRSMKEKAIEVLNKYNPENKTGRTELHLYAWPQRFGSTAGPGNCGGQTIRTYTLFAWVDDWGHAAVECCGYWKFVPNTDFKPLMHINWEAGEVTLTGESRSGIGGYVDMGCWVDSIF